MRRWLRRLLLLMTLGLGAVAALAYDAWTLLHAPLPLAQTTRIEIEPGSRLREVGSRLAAQGVLHSRRQALYLEIYARQRGLAAGIKAGEYDLTPGLTPLGVLDLWLSGKTVLHELRIIEGMRFEQVLQQLLQHPKIRVTLADARPETAMRALGHAGQHPEGRFFPDTYLFQRGTADLEVLRRAYAAMEQALAAEWATRAPDLPLETPDQALTLASIVEKETGLAGERPEIAGVFARRLRLGMRLQTDPTVIYGIGATFDGNIRRGDLETDTPYNTYTRAGLPPTPICLPGRAALHAALHPAAGTSLYFVARGDGSHQFSSTLAEHEAAVDRYQRRRR